MLRRMKPSLGPSSIVGWISAAAALATAIVISAQEGVSLFTHGSKPAGIIAGLVLIATHLGRQYQAAHLPGSAAVGAAVDKLPPALEALAAEAQANVAKVQASPDGVDGPQVAFATGEQEPAPAAPAPTQPAA